MAMRKACPPSATSHAQFPPSHPDLHLSSITGSQSVIFTWSESFSELPPHAEVDKGTVVAGAVLVVGAAVAVYGIRTRSGNTSALLLNFANTREHPSVQTQDWKRLADGCRVP